jgi:hypothetical protein
MYMQTLTDSKLVDIFYECDEFIKQISAELSRQGRKEPCWHSRFSRSEVMTVLISYHLSGFKTLKYFYEQSVQCTLRSDFPAAPCYDRFVSLIPHVVVELWLLMHYRKHPSRKANYLDSKPLKICHIKREKSNKVFAGIARKGKGTMGWFIGFKLHIVVGYDGRIVEVLLSTGNVADNNHGVLRRLLEGKTGCFYGDRGYNSTLKGMFAEQGIDLISKLKKNDKTRSMPVREQDAYYLRHRGLIESVLERMVGLGDIEHTRHRSPINFLSNLAAGLLAYSFSDRVPHIIAFNQKNKPVAIMKNAA